MALTPFRWLAFVLAGFVLVLLIVGSMGERREWRPGRREVLSSRVGRAQNRAAGVAERIYLLRLHDSIRKTLPKAAVAGRTLVDRSFDAPIRASVNTLVDRAAAARHSVPKVATDIIVLRDTVPRIRGSERWGFPGALTVDYLLPGAATNGRCVALARVDTRLDRSRGPVGAELTSDVSAMRLLGPCAFYEAYGQPGPQIDQWLRKRGWRMGQASHWNGERFIWVVPSWGGPERLPLDEVLTSNGVACAYGSDAQCLEAMLGSASHSARRIQLGDVVLTNTYNPFTQGGHPWYSSSFAFGPMEWTLLADMARTLGPQRFAAFWSSDRAPAEAFERAAGQPLAAWTRDWITRMYHEAGEEGPSLDAASAGIAMLLLVLGVSISVVAARRRQVA